MASERYEEKTCHTCGRPFKWRKKWAKSWPQVRYCSRTCRRGLSRLDRDVEESMLALLDGLPNLIRSKTGVTDTWIAQQVLGAGWRSQVEVVRRAARRLVLSGDLEVRCDGFRVDDLNFRGEITVHRRATREREAQVKPTIFNRARL